MSEPTSILIQQATIEQSLMLDLTEDHHGRYAARHNMGYQIVRGTMVAPRLSIWNKIFLIREALAAGYEYVFWLDNDTLLVRPEEDLRNALPVGKWLGLVAHPATPALERHWNVGVILVRNTPEARRFFEDVWISWPVAHPLEEQAAVNRLLEHPTYRDGFVALSDAYNSTYQTNEDPAPIISAWHNYHLSEDRAQLMRLALDPLLPACPLAIHIAVHGGKAALQECLNSLERFTSGPYRLRLWDNASDPQTAGFLRNYAAGRHQVELIRREENTGFGDPHNALVTMASEPYVAFVNSDIIVGPRWNLPMVAALTADPQIGAASAVRWHFHTSPYLEASCLIMRREDALRFGPFDTQRFPFAYCEDVDLSARLTTAGYRLAHFPHAGFRHPVLGSTSLRVEAEGGVDVSGYMQVNQQRYVQRWPYAARSEHLIHIKRTGGIGDVLCCTPAFAALRRARPEARIIVHTHSPESLLNNPDIDDIYLAEEQGDWTFNLDNYDGGPERHIVDAFAHRLGVTLGERRPVMRLTAAERAWVQTRLPEKYLVFATHTGWPIRDWPWSYWTQLVRWSRQKWPGLTVVLAGYRKQHPMDLEGVIDLRGKTRLRHVMAVIAGASGYTGCDTGITHIAGAFAVPSVVLSGPVDVNLRLHEGQVGINTPLACAGCYGRQTPGVLYRFEICLREHTEIFEDQTYALCMERIRPEQVFAQMEEHFPCLSGN